MTAKIVYTVQQLSKSGKVYIRRVWTTHVLDNGSISAKLECLPTCQDMPIMDYVERKEETR